MSTDKNYETSNEKLQEADAMQQNGPKKDTTSRDIGRMALFVSLLGVIIIAIFFFAMNQNITGVMSDVKNLQSLSDRLNAQEARIVEMETKLASIDDIPAKARRMMIASMLEEMALEAAYLSEVTADESQAAALQQAQKLLEDVQKEMSH